MPSLAESMDQSLLIGIHDIGISIVNDLTREEMLYISFNKSKVVWTETKKSRIKPLSTDLNNQLENNYQIHQEACDANLTDQKLLKKKYKSKDYPVKYFLFLSIFH
jgi:hypothetical protein